MSFINQVIPLTEMTKKDDDTQFVLVDATNAAMVKTWQDKGYELPYVASKSKVVRYDFSTSSIAVLRKYCDEAGIQFAPTDDRFVLIDALQMSGWRPGAPKTSLVAETDDSVDPADDSEGEGEEGAETIPDAPVAAPKPMSRKALRAARNKDKG